jgi:hypothetical protein
MKKLFKLTTALMLVLFATSTQLLASNAPSQEERERIALQAYLYTYPLVLMDVTRKQMTNMEAGKMLGRGPMMEFTHMRKFPEADFKEVVRPNFDTLYSLAWLDLSKEPVILSVPAVKDRFYMLPMLDMWTDVFAVVGTYGTGTEAQNFAITMPSWKGKLPKGVKRIDAPTPYIWILGRTQTNGVKDYDYIHKIQDGFKVTPLSSWGKSYKPSFKKDPLVDDKTPPLVQIQKLSAKEYFDYAMKLMKKHPAHITDMVMLSRMEHIGLTPKNFDFDKLPKATQKALVHATKISHDEMKKYMPKLGTNANGW